MNFDKKKLDKLQFFYENFDHRILCYTRTNTADIVIITYFSSQTRTDYQIKNFPHNGQWIDWLTNEIYSVEDGILQLNLKPFDGKVLLRQN